MKRTFSVEVTDIVQLVQKWLETTGDLPSNRGWICSKDPLLGKDMKTIDFTFEEMLSPKEERKEDT